MKRNLLFFLLGVLIALPVGVFAGVQQFSDMNGSEWYASDVNELVDTGIITGYKDGSFKGDAPVSRAEVSVMMNRLVHYFQKEQSMEGLSDDAFYAEVKKGIDRYIAEQQAAAAGFASATQAKQDETAKSVPALTSTDHVYGDKNAKYLLYIYSDLHCPFCKKFHTTAKEFVDTNSGVAFVFRHFPLEALHPDAKKIAEASECIAKVGGETKFWEFLDINFDGDAVLREADLEATVDSIGLDYATFKTCYDGKEFATRVESSMKEATTLGIQGTPASILKNTTTGDARFINGAYPIETLNEKLGEI